LSPEVEARKIFRPAANGRGQGTRQDGSFSSIAVVSVGHGEIMSSHRRRNARGEGGFGATERGEEEEDDDDGGDEGTLERRPSQPQRWDGVPHDPTLDAAITHAPQRSD